MSLEINSRVCPELYISLIVKVGTLLPTIVGFPKQPEGSIMTSLLSENSSLGGTG
jgi:hypothetical protein